jgi:hypothetical protein
VQEGFYQSGPTTEVICPAGKSGSGGNATCQDCWKGTFQSTAGKTTCNDCPSGWGNSGNGSTGCNAVPPGSYTLNGIQKVCQRGYTCAGANASRTPCSNGTYTNNTGSVSCIPCSPGTFSNQEKSVVCNDCPIGYLQPEPEQSKCDPVQAGSIVAKGGSSSVVVPLGSKIDASALSGFQACSIGTVGIDPPNESCKNCPHGTSSTPGAITCQACDKGKFNGKSGGTCRKCLKETFQDQSTSTSCIACPAGWLQPNEGSSVCISLNWKTPSSCKDTLYLKNEYLNNTAMVASLWECQPCPKGKDFFRMVVVMLCYVHYELFSLTTFFLPCCRW